MLIELLYVKNVAKISKTFLERTRRQHLCILFICKFTYVILTCTSPAAVFGSVSEALTVVSAAEACLFYMQRCLRARRSRSLRYWFSASSHR